MSLLADPDFRERLTAVTRQTAADSPEFRQIRALGKGFEKGLVALLFETDLQPLVREVAIF